MPQKSLKQRIATGMKDTQAYAGRQMAFAAIRPPTRAMREQHAELASRVRGIKEQALQNAPQLRRRAVESMRQNGFHVFEAADAEEARAYILRTTGDGPLIKSKSNTAHEIQLTEALAQNGVDTIETDLGDRLCQLGDTEHSHPLAPAIHLSVERAAELLSAEAGTTLTPQPQVLVKAARETLRREFFRARVGLSGANAISADTGSVVLTENEGNIRAVTSLPETHIVLAGWEKIVPTLEDALAVVQATAAYGGGTAIGTYVSVISGHPSRGGEEDPGTATGRGTAPRNVHVVLLDNGRQEALDAGFGEALSCVNCGACLNHCPIYAEIGSNYGFRHFGGRGVVFTAFHAGLRTAVESGLSLCLNCRSCVDVCPVGIETPRLINNLRERATAEGHAPFFKKRVLKTVLEKQRTNPAYSAGRRVQGVLFRREGDAGQKLRLPGLPNLPRLPRLPNLPSRERTFPRLPPQPLDRAAPTRSSQAPDVVFFPGCLSRYVYPEVGRAVLTALQSRGVDAALPPRHICCGLPLAVNGFREEAGRLAAANARLLHETGAGEVVTACGSCGTAFREEYPRLVSGADPHVDWLSANVRDISQLLLEKVEPSRSSSSGSSSSGASPSPVPAALEARVTYHDPCHLARGMGVREEPRELLRRISGLELVEMEEADTCCGCAGAFSLEHYPLAHRINERKLSWLQDTGADLLVTGCAACIAHFRDGISRAGTGQRVLHTAQLWERACRGTGERDA